MQGEGGVWKKRRRDFIYIYEPSPRFENHSSCSLETISSICSFMLAFLSIIPIVLFHCNCWRAIKEEEEMEEGGLFRVHRQ